MRAGDANVDNSLFLLGTALHKASKIGEKNEDSIDRCRYRIIRRYEMEEFEVKGNGKSD